MNLFSIARRRPALRTSASRRRHCAWSALMLGTALGVAACGDAMGPLPSAGVPDEFALSIGGFGVTGKQVVLRGDTVILRRTSFTSSAVSDSVRTVPTPDAWRAFWTATDRAGVRLWRSQYVAEGIVDGNGWNLRIVAGGRRIESRGSNAYPDRFGDEHEAEMTDDFRAFLAAVSALVGSPVNY